MLPSSLEELSPLCIETVGRRDATWLERDAPRVGHHIIHMH